VGIYSSRKKEKVLTALLCLVGISAVTFGMATRNHPVFVLGLLFVIGGYLLIRRKLKAYMKDKYG
jgi:hypothetical protein